MNRRNSTRTLLWPQPQAWDGFRLGDYLPGWAYKDVERRTRAMRVLALYRWARRAALACRARAALRPGDSAAAGQLRREAAPLDAPPAAGRSPISTPPPAPPPRPQPIVPGRAPAQGHPRRRRYGAGHRV